MSDQQAIIELFRDKKSFCLVSHVLPDGDSIGSLLALGEALQSMGKNVKIYSPGGVPRKYAFLKGSEQIAAEKMVVDKETVVVVLDSSDLERISLFRDDIVPAEILVNIDHHLTNQHYGHLNLVDPGAAATGEIIFNILLEMETGLTHSIAEALYVAIATDTGSFKFDNTTANTHRVVAALLEYSISPGTLSQRVFDEHPLSFYLLLKDALATLELHGDGKIAVITLSREMLERHGSLTEDTEGMINYTRNIEGVEVGILFYVESDEEVKVGFRSRNIDISELAEKLNGGGHARAAGCRIHGRYEQVKEKVIAEAEALLCRNEG